jgi:hypothetical protein
MDIIYQIVTLVVNLQLSLIRFELYALRLLGLALTSMLRPHEQLFDNRL